MGQKVKAGRCPIAGGTAWRQNDGRTNYLTMLLSVIADSALESESSGGILTYSMPSEGIRCDDALKLPPLAPLLFNELDRSVRKPTMCRKTSPA